MDNHTSKDHSLVPLPSGSLLLCNNPEKRKRKFNDLAEMISKPASALQRLKAFLPDMAAANADMDSKLLKDPGCYNAEDVEEDDGPIIKMNVALVPMDFDNGIDSGITDLGNSDEMDSTNDESLSDSSTDDDNDEICGNKSHQSLEKNAEGDAFVTEKLKLTKSKQLKEQPLIETIEVIEHKSSDNLLDNNTAVVESQVDNAKVIRD